MGQCEVYGIISLVHLRVRRWRINSVSSLFFLKVSSISFLFITFYDAKVANQDLIIAKWKYNSMQKKKKKKKKKERKKIYAKIRNNFLEKNTYQQKRHRPSGVFKIMLVQFARIYSPETEKETVNWRITERGVRTPRNPIFVPVRPS